MKKNLLINNIITIQNEYKELLLALLPKIQMQHCFEALDEISIFWFKYIKIVQLYLYNYFCDEDSYVFTGFNSLDFNSHELLPFLLLGKKHIFDDPLNMYSKMGASTSYNGLFKDFHNKIKITVENNINIIKNVNNNILILPISSYHQVGPHKLFFEIGENAFISLFNGIESIKDYFQKCNTIEDILQYGCNNIDKIIIFSENDNKSLPIIDRFYNAKKEINFAINQDMPDAHIFLNLIIGHIYRALDAIVLCSEYKCTPFIKSVITIHYILLLTENMTNIEYINLLRYRMIIAHFLCKLFNSKKISISNFDSFMKVKKEYNFNKRLFDTLKEQGITSSNFSLKLIHQIIDTELNKFSIILN